VLDLKLTAQAHSLLSLRRGYVCHCAVAWGQVHCAKEDIFPRGPMGSLHYCQVRGSSPLERARSSALGQGLKTSHRCPAFLRKFAPLAAFGQVWRTHSTGGRYPESKSGTLRYFTQIKGSAVRVAYNMGLMAGMKSMMAPEFVSILPIATARNRGWSLFATMPQSVSDGKMPLDLCGYTSCYQVYNDTVISIADMSIWIMTS